MKKFVRLGVLVPVLLGLTFAADVGFRLLGPTGLAFRAWEAMRGDGAALGCFRPGATYLNERASGDLSNLGNLPQRRELHREVFTTDAFGFRNDPRDLDGPPPEAILVGSSFSVGPVCDDETLAARIRERTGRKIYNAAGVGPRLPVLRELARRLRVSRGTILCEQLLRFDTPDIAEMSRGVPPPPPRNWLRWGLRSEYWNEGPGAIVAHQQYRRLQNDRILPNPMKANVIEGVVGGRPMLFYPPDREVPMAADLPRAFEFWRWLAAQLREDNLGLLVIFVPTKTVVYGPLAQGVKPVREVDLEAVDLLVARLRHSGIGAVNLTGVLRREAASALGSGRLLYWSDDTHWNPEGIRVAAAEVSTAWNLR